MSSNTTMLHIAEQAAKTKGDAIAHTFLDENVAVQETLTHEELWSAAGSIAGYLASQNLVPGDTALMAFPPGLDFTIAFVGCMRAGVIGVPVPPPDFSASGERAQHEASKFNVLAQAADAKVVLTDSTMNRFKGWSKIKGMATPWRANMNSEMAELSWLVTSDIYIGQYDAPNVPLPSVDDVAFLQFTSGSTSAPKGVRITHGNIMHQCLTVEDLLNGGSSAVSVSWMPNFHDFSLVSHICQALAGGIGHLVQMSPLTFLRKPAAWFEAMSQYRATHAACPPFALALALRKTKPEQRAQWDLSNIGTLMLAAEPIQPKLIEDFFNSFASTGISKDAFVAAYGLAEHTVGITIAKGCGLKVAHVDIKALEETNTAVIVEKDAAGSRTVVSCGPVIADTKVVMVDPVTKKQVLGNGVGEVWASGPSVADGYHLLPKISEETFRCRLQDSEDDTAYLRTGDLGFMYNGDLYITGRSKEMIILRGRNLYPADIELSATESHTSIRPGSVASFSASEDGEQERLIVVAELVDARVSKEQAEEITAAIRRTVLQHHTVAIGSVVLAHPRTVVTKTTSGKVRRREVRENFMKNNDTLGSPAAIVIASHVRR